MTLTAERPAAHGPTRLDLQQRHDELVRRHAVELRLSGVVAAGGGIAALVRTVSELTTNPLWLIDPQRRVVAHSQRSAGSDVRAPDIDLLLERHGPVDLSATDPLLIPAEPDRGVVRRHLVVPVVRGGCLHAWLVVAEVGGRLTRDDAALAGRAAFHLASEYAVQRRVAQASWNARSALARQLIRGVPQADDLADAGDYLGVRADADRVVVHVSEQPGAGPRDEAVMADRLARELGVEVLVTRVSEGTVLLVEALDDAVATTFVHQVKRVVRQLLAEMHEPVTNVGVSGVTRCDGLRRAHRETCEVVQCLARFASSADRVIAVEDLGPARLLVANADVGSVRRHVHDILGPLLVDGSGMADLLCTLQQFFDTGRSVRESAGRLGVHENTVRLRLAKVHDLTGLDVASDANDQLSVQTALLVLRLEGHPAIPSFDAEAARVSRPDDHQVTA